MDCAAAEANRDELFETCYADHLSDDCEWQASVHQNVQTVKQLDDRAKYIILLLQTWICNSLLLCYSVHLRTL